MQRYFVERENMTEDIVIITGEDVKHITKVMRMNIGDDIICSNNQSRTVRCQIVEHSDSEVKARVIEELMPNTELPVKVTIAQGLPKGDKLELIIQKGTELGAKSFIPFAAARSIVKWDQKKSHKKIERLEKIAKEAAEQSYREQIPTISDVKSLHHLINHSLSYDAIIVAYEEAAKDDEQSKFVQTLNGLTTGQSILVIIGPEGGLTSEEITYLKEQGATICGLGPRILRTETAALYALSAISYHFELMR